MPGEQVNVALGHPPLTAYAGQAMDYHHIHPASDNGLGHLLERRAV